MSSLRIQTSVPALVQAAGIAEQQGELERSLSYWIRAKKIEPDNPEVLFGFGRVCLKMDLLDDAEPALTKAASLRPDDPSYQYALAAAKVGKRQFQAAEDLLENLIKVKASDPQIEYAMGSVLYLEGHLAEASAHLRESVRLLPNQSGPPTIILAGDQGKDAEAISMLEDLLHRYP